MKPESPKEREKREKRGIYTRGVTEENEGMDTREVKGQEKRGRGGALRWERRLVEGPGDGSDTGVEAGELEEGALG